jgi:excisionase family DNA binding protein
MRRKAPKPYLTLEETAATLRVSERTVRRWISRGIVAARKIAGTVRVAREAIVEGKVNSRRPRKGRPARSGTPSVSALSDEVFARTWDNPEDAVYDRWRKIYGLRKR